MVIGTVYYFVDLDLGAEIFFEKEGATGKGDINSEIVELHFSAHFYLGRRKFHTEPVCFFIVFLVTKKHSF